MIILYWWRYITDSHFRECIRTTRKFTKMFISKDCADYHKLRLKMARKRPYDVFIKGGKWHW